MEYILAEKATWGNFFFMALGLLLLYFVLQFVNRILKGSAFLKVFQKPIESSVYRLLLMYEMLVLIILGCIFILINPFYHGILLVVFLTVGFNHIKNYFSGRLIKIGDRIRTGNNIRTGNLEGIVSKMERLGIMLQTKEGIHYLQYNQMLDKGYTMLSGDDIGGIFQLKMTPIEQEEKKVNHIIRVQDLLITTPYLDWHHKPEVVVGATESEIQARVLLREESHLKELMRLIKEWGYEVEQA